MASRALPARQSAAIIIAFGALLAALSASDAATPPLRGFTVASSAVERQNEQIFLAQPSADGARNSSAFINRAAHFDGSPGDHRLALYMRDRLQSFGLSASIQTTSAVIDTPADLRVEILGTPKVVFNLREAREPKDPDVSRADAGVPYNAGAADGDVRAPVVYVARGTDLDYAVLRRHGVSVNGKIALIRYGAQFRGLLAQRAQRNGAAGIIFYSDPKDDGFARGKPYPYGPYRPMGAVQRGTVGGGIRIPVLPITAINAQQLLARMRGISGPPGWNGALPVSYVVGQTSVAVRLRVKLHRQRKTLWNTIGVIEGRDPTQSVVLGGHRDAWVYGVTDNGSGISVLLETARGLGYLHAHGWTPARTIVVAGWDAEETSGAGANAYIAAHRSALANGCAAYINEDEVAVGSDFGAVAVDGLAPEILEVAHDVGGHPKLSRVDVPGGGSDHEAFITRLGTPVVAGISYDGPFGAWHSAYDDLRYAATVADPGFVHHRSLAQLVGVLAMRIADAQALPYSFASYGTTLKHAVADATAHAQKVNTAVDLRPLSAAVTRLGLAARHADARIARGDGAENAAYLQAAELIDAQTFGAAGYASSLFPAIGAALDARGANAAGRAVADSTAALERAARLLVR